MADVAVSTQLQQWTFEKPAASRSDSTASSPDLSHQEPETLRIDDAAVHAATSIDSKDASTFQERYLSSEEDLSPMDGNSSDDNDYDSDVSIHEAKAQPSFSRARTMSISHWNKGKSCDLAVTVSYVSAGRPKMIEVAQSPIQETPQRSASLAELPVAAISKLRQQRQQRQQKHRSLFVTPSTISRPKSPAISIDTRRPSTGSAPFTHSNRSAVLVSESRSASASASSLQSHGSTPRSSSPSVSEKSTTSTRPVSAAGFQPRSSLYVVSSARDSNPLAPFPPLTPQSPGPHAFLSSDPYENATTSAASPIIKASPHKRLRSISQKLSLARIAIAPSKKWDVRTSSRAGNMPPTPSTPLTPMTAPLPTTSTNKLRRNSRLMSRPGTARGPSPDIPPLPAVATMSPKKSSTANVKKMVARGADEREPILELPPCPDEDAPGSAVSSIKSRRIRKRKSLMDLL